jgi:hypothetical protein
MRKLLAGFIVVTIVNFANSVAWLGSYDKALSQAKKEHKAILILLAKRGDNSKKVVAKYFTNKKYVDLINQRSVAVILYFDDKTSYPIELLYTREFPTLFLLNSQTETFTKKPLYAKEIDEKTLEEFLKNL